MKKNYFDVIVLGGGSAGMAAALKAQENGASVAIVERDKRLGGILNQCIHNGFGLNYFKEELTGPEYAQRFAKKVNKAKIPVFLETTVLKIEQGFKIFALNGSGLQVFSSKAIVLALGCKERPAGAISLCGTRPAGVITAGSAQKIVNTTGKMIGKNIVVVGSGDIGLIMARRLRYEGANVIGVFEILPYPSGLKRNIVQCLNDYNIPMHLSKTVVEVSGEDRVDGVWVAPVNKDFCFDLKKKEFIPCDTVVLSIGLVPENDIAFNFGIKPNTVTSGAEVDEFLQTSFDGIFSCGNALHVHDIVDKVSTEAEEAAENAAKFAKNILTKSTPISIEAGDGIRYVNPSSYYEGEGILTLKFRSNGIFKN